jgi:hypothetical protein
VLAAFMDALREARERGRHERKSNAGVFPVQRDGGIIFAGKRAPQDAPLTWGWAVSFLLFSLIGSVQPLAVGVSCAYQPQKACTSEIKELTSRLGRSHKATC